MGADAVARDAARGVGGAEESRGVPLLTDLGAFYLEHEHCGDLDSAVERDRVWMTYTCGAVITRYADDDD